MLRCVHSTGCSSRQWTSGNHPLTRDIRVGHPPVHWTLSPRFDFERAVGRHRPLLLSARRFRDQVLQLDASPELTDLQAALTSLNGELQRFWQLSLVSSSCGKSALRNATPLFKLRGFEDDVDKWLRDVGSRGVQESWSSSTKSSVVNSLLHESATACHKYEGWRYVD